MDGDKNVTATFRSTAVPRISRVGFDRESKTATLSWGSAAGVVYEIEISDNLIDWLPLQVVNGAPDADTTTATGLPDDPTLDANGQRFYRLRERRSAQPVEEVLGEMLPADCPPCLCRRNMMLSPSLPMGGGLPSSTGVFRENARRSGIAHSGRHLALHRPGPRTAWPRSSGGLCEPEPPGQRSDGQTLNDDRKDHDEIGQVNKQFPGQFRFQGKRQRHGNAAPQTAPGQ